MFEAEKIGPALYRLPMTGAMKVPGLVVATSALMEEIAFDQPLQQVRHVACLPGIRGYSIAMPDMHWGYGFPIGGVAGMDPEEGVVSPGGVGYDINCGVRLALIPRCWRDLDRKQQKDLLRMLYGAVPSGVGRGHKQKRKLSRKDYRAIADKGAGWAVEQGYGFQADLDHCESLGLIEGADLQAVSDHAQSRGSNQLGSLGSGNHFVELGVVQQVFRPELAQAWGLEEGQIYILIHSGSRGFGHQVCQDTLTDLVKKGYAEGLPDKQLVAAPIKSADGQRYLAAMATAANFAFNNRQMILHAVRQALRAQLGIAPEEVRLVYDVCHNIAKFEDHEFEGQKIRLCVHRKGATRAFGSGARELAPLYRETGQPVLVPGDMGTASHLMVGLGHPLTWASSCHGAGRCRSRIQSMKAWKGKDLIAHMESQGILVAATSTRTIAEEMPDAYKDVDQVVEAVEEAGLAAKVVRLRPRLVVKG